MTVLRGRTAERAQLSRLMDKARGGESAALVVRGEAGIGKTALLDHCAGQASDFQVVRIAGVESEMELPFAGLHQLCAPMLVAVHRLPEPQQNALQVAFGLMLGGVPDRFMVGLATLSLLSEVALTRPLLCLVDDAQWLDSASSQVLGFVGRRLLGESVLVLFAIREPSNDRNLTGLPELALEGLADADAQALLSAATPGPIDAQVRDRIVAETRGNPLALMELPKGMTTAELVGGFPVPYPGDLPAQLEGHFLRRLKLLPETTQRFMLVAAADPTGDVALLWHAAQVLGITANAAAPPDFEQLVEVGAQVRFRHPLVRSAIYSNASAEERRAVHLALAEAIDPESDPDRRAWHRALATEGRDEEVASDLERSASRAQSRGGLAAAAAFLQRSVALTKDPQRRADRALAAAQAHIQAGAFDEALRLLATGEIDAENELQRATVDLLRGQIALAAGPVFEAAAQLLKAGKRLETLDVRAARETYLDAWAAAMYAGRLGKNGRLREVSEAARAAPVALGPPRSSDLLLDGSAQLISEGLAAAVPTLRAAVRAFLAEEMSVERGHQWGVLAVASAGTLWDFESISAIVSRQVELARPAGALAPLYFALVIQLLVVTLRGDLAEAEARVAELETLTEATGIRDVSAAVFVAALTGREPHSSTFIESEVARAKARGEGTLADLGLWAAAVLYNGLVRYEQALSAAHEVSESPVFHLGAWVLPELVEAAARAGRTSLSADALERLARISDLVESDWARGVLARCQGLVGDAETAEEHYRTAIECLGRTALRPDAARAHLVYGEWLRRQNRRMDARKQLHIAHDMFREIGMLAFAERARHELSATGETVRKRRDENRNDLTPQEEQIARLALEGRTNPEIGAQLFLSARTVEWHLRKVFTKLRIVSRRDLRDALPARASTIRQN
jgi:DNA-binding CsgD family transcriptional regulator